MSYLDPGATVGGFIVGDGTLVGAGPTAHYDPAGLVLTGKAFNVVELNDLEQINLQAPYLLCRGKKFNVLGTSVIEFGSPRLTLKGKQTIRTEPDEVHFTERPALNLNGKAINLVTSSTLAVEKPTLTLIGMEARASVPGLVPNVPVTVDLVPTEPETEMILLIPSVPQNRDLVPTEEVFR